MVIKNVDPIEYVSRSAYEKDIDDRLALPDISPGGLYVARFVTNLMCENDYAADYSVRVDDIAYPKNRKILPALATDYVALKLTPLTPDNNECPDAERLEKPVWQDGLLFDRKRLKLNFKDVEAGYIYNPENIWEKFQDAPDNVRLPDSPLITV